MAMKKPNRKWLGCNCLANLETLKHVLVLLQYPLQHGVAVFAPLLLGDLSGLKLLPLALVDLAHE